MRKLILLLLLACALFGNAQTNWPPVGTEWYYNYTNDDLEKGYLHFIAEKEATINDTPCMAIAVFAVTASNIEQLHYEYIYSENGVVYNYHHNRFNKLMDFNASVGDTINLYIEGINNYSRMYAPARRERVRHVVVQKDSVFFAGKKRLFLDLEYIEDDTVLNMRQYGFMYFQRIIEGIGSDGFLFGNYFHGIVTSGAGELRCFNKGTISYNNGTPCDYLPTEIESNEESGLVQIMQNPATETLSLRINEQAISAFLYLEIIDITGTILFQQKVEGSEMSIPVSNLPNGVYMYRVVGEETVSGMFVKE